MVKLLLFLKKKIQIGTYKVDEEKRLTGVEKRMSCRRSPPLMSSVSLRIWYRLNNLVYGQNEIAEARRNEYWL